MIAIIGAGPAGCYLALLLAKAGKQVELFEEHKKVGLPLQCAGLVTAEFLKFFPSNKKFIINKISKIKIIAPNKNWLELKLRKPNLILDRIKFDKWLAQQARKTGAKLRLGHRFVGFKNELLKFKNKTKLIKADLVVGADGPFSAVARATGLWQKRELRLALQARVKGRFEKEIEVHIGPGFFGWVIPESSKIARIGVLAKKAVKKKFNCFLKKQLKRNKAKVLNRQAGFIPVYKPGLRVQKNNIF